MKKLSVKKGAECMACLQCVAACSEAFFKEFLKENIDNLKSEFFIPLMVNKVINDGTATMRVLQTSAKWFGVTYKEDKPQLMQKIEELIAAGEYPRNLWE